MKLSTALRNGIARGREKCGAVGEGVGFGMNEGESKSACEAKLRKKVTQSKSVLEGSPRSNIPKMRPRRRKSPEQYRRQFEYLSRCNAED